eukprot:scaffold27465_cov38-Tisochrysis_lutea.AAC.2
MSVRVLTVWRPRSTRYQNLLVYRMRSNRCVLGCQLRRAYAVPSRGQLCGTEHYAATSFRESIAGL